MGEKGPSHVVGSGIVGPGSAEEWWELGLWREGVELIGEEVVEVVMEALQFLIMGRVESERDMRAWNKRTGH